MSNELYELLVSKLLEIYKDNLCIYMNQNPTLFKVFTDFLSDSTCNSIRNIDNTKAKEIIMEIHKVLLDNHLYVFGGD